MLQPPKVKFDYLLEESYLAFIKNSVGSKAYQSFFVKKNGRAHDVLGKGDLSCAFFVSAILYMFGLINKPSFTVAKTAEKFLAKGAKRVPLSRIKPGDVLIWIPRVEKTGRHNHIGFYVGNKEAVSNSDKKRSIVKHNYEFNGKRKIEMALRPDWLKTNAKS
jgi:hypothetical protein